MKNNILSAFKNKHLISITYNYDMTKNESVVLSHCKQSLKGNNLNCLSQKVKIGINCAQDFF